MITSNRKFINIMYDIFGYSFVGILAYLFGLVLQNYNSNGEFFKMILNYAGNVRSVILVIFVQLLLILLFGHAYAKSILFGKEDLEAQDGIDVCAIVGHWLETIIVIIAVVLVMIQIIWPTFLNQYFWCTVLSNSASYILSFIAYRRLLVKKYYSEKEQNKLMALRVSSRYVLFCPAAVMIGFNIISGANICAMLEGSPLCYVCSIVICVGLLCIYLVNGNLLKYVPALYLLVVTGFGIASLSDFGNPNNGIVLKNFFLASMVSVFLSIFESWYVVFRQKENSPNALYFRLTLGVVSAAPAVVAILFPIQNFNLIYFVAFWIGMGITDYISFVIVFPIVNSTREEGEETEEYKKTKRRVAIARAVCGIATLILLMLDKYFAFMPKWHDSGAQLISDDAVSMISSLVSLLTGVFGISVPLVNHKKRNDGSDYFYDSQKKWKTEAYMTLRIILIVVASIFSIYLYGFTNGDYVKAKLSSFAILIYLFFSLWIFWKSTRLNADAERG